MDELSSASTAVSVAGDPPELTPKELARQLEYSDDSELRQVLQRGLKSVRDQKHSGRTRFRDLVFTRRFSALDGRNEDASNNPFHGFYTLFWLSVALFVFKIACKNWAAHGNILGTNEIMKLMFRREVVVLLLSDGIMCGATGMSWLLQRAILSGYLDWDRGGWVAQHAWQTVFVASVVGIPSVRDWPWSHTVYFVLHGLIMLMKQHSFAFYNGYLSTRHKQRQALLSNLKQLENVTPTPDRRSGTSPAPESISTFHLDRAPTARETVGPATAAASASSSSAAAEKHGSDVDKISAAIASGRPLDLEQVQLFERVIKWEIDARADELRPHAAGSAYPDNLTAANHYEYVVLPTLVYKLDYPRTDAIDWFFVAEKVAAMFGIILVMIMISQAFIYPVVMKTVAMKQAGMPLAQRIREFPSLQADLIFPFMIEWLLAWYLIWETILNILAEVTYFADRSFYDAWWNSVSWDGFARDWNRPVHNFLLRHVYQSSISSMKVGKHTATIITFFLSACVHELVMWCIFRKLRGYLLFLQMCQLPLVRLSRSKWLKGRKTLGNLIFWLGIYTCPSLLCSLYLVL